MPRDPHSQPLEDAHPDLRHYLVACAACGRVGRTANVDWENFRPKGYGPWITEAASKSYEVLPLDERGFCHGCASAERIAATHQA